MNVFARLVCMVDAPCSLNSLVDSTALGKA